MLTRYDRQLLSLLRLIRFQETFPDLPNYCIAANKIIFDSHYQEKTDDLIRQSNILLHEAAIIFGINSLEIRHSGVFWFAASLQLQESIDTGSKDMVATTEQSKARATEFQGIPERMQIIPWSRVALSIEASEADLKGYLNEQKVPFYWAENGEWGVEESEATLLVQSYFQSKAAAEIAAMKSSLAGGWSQESKPETKAPATQKAKKEKPATSSTSKLPPIKLIGSYSPIKNLLDSARRYLEAIAPGDDTAQNRALDEIITGDVRGKKHIKLALSGYKPEEMPTEVELAAAFLRLRDRKIKEATKPTATATETESQAEEIPEELAQD